MGLIGLAACGAADAGDEVDVDDGPIASHKQPILAGGLLPLDNNSLATNMVTLPGCSAVALDSEWVATAEHCVIDKFGNSLIGVGASVTLLQPSETRTVREILLHPLPNDTNTPEDPEVSGDGALLRVFPFSSTVVKPVRLYGAPLSLLPLPFPLKCVGQGGNALILDSTGDAAVTGAGTWRQADLFINQIHTPGNNGFKVLPNGSGQMQVAGDSGGPCFATTPDQEGNLVLMGTLAIWNWQGTPPTPKDSWLFGYSPANTLWADNFRNRSRVIFHGVAGLLANASLSPGGAFGTANGIGGFTQWNKVIVLRNGALLLYKNNGDWGAGMVNKDGTPVTHWTWSGLPANITHFAPVGRDFIFLYQASSGLAWILKLTADGGTFQLGPAMGLSANWQHLVGTREGGVMFFQSNGGVGATGRVDANGNWSQSSSFSGFSPWTHLTAVNKRGLFFYNSQSGLHCTGQITSTGFFQQFNCANALPPGVTHVVGASNGALLTYNNGTGTGVTATVSPTGVVSWITYPPVTSISSGWTSVTAE